MSCTNFVKPLMKETWTSCKVVSIGFGKLGERKEMFNYVVDKQNSGLRGIALSPCSRGISFYPCLGMDNVID